MDRRMLLQLLMLLRHLLLKKRRLSLPISSSIFPLMLSLILLLSLISRTVVCIEVSFIREDRRRFGSCVLLSVPVTSPVGVFSTTSVVSTGNMFRMLLTKRRILLTGDRRELFLFSSFIRVFLLSSSSRSQIIFYFSGKSFCMSFLFSGFRSVFVL